MEGMIGTEIGNFYINSICFPSNKMGLSKTRLVPQIYWKLDFISSNLDKCCAVYVILLDSAKAFDSVPLKRLLSKKKRKSLSQNAAL